MITEEQRIERRNFLGSSDIAAIFGLDPWRNQADVYYSKVGPFPDEPENPGTAIRLGNNLEHGLLQLAAEDLRVSIEPDVRRVHEDGIFAANLDALIAERDEAIEVKTSGLQNPMWDDSEWGTPGTDEVPDRVIMQVHHQMLCANLSTVHVAALLGRGRGFNLYRINRNDGIINAIVDEGTRFWELHVLTKTPPADVRPSTEFLRTRPRNEGETTTIDNDLFERLQAAKEAEKAARAAVKDLEAEVLHTLGDAETALCDLGQITYRQTVTRRFDTKAFQAEHPDLHTQFLEESAYRSLRMRPAK